MQTQLTGTLPETANFARQVELNRTIEGVYPISSLERLGELLLSKEGEVKVKLEFGDCVGYACIKGSVSATLITECQRCLQPVDIHVEGKFKFALVESEEDFELIPEDMEPYLLEGDEQSIIQLVEDELLLGIPMVAVHDSACSDFMVAQEEAIAAEKEARHPFAALKDLKSKLDD